MHREHIYTLYYIYTWLATQISPPLPASGWYLISFTPGPPVTGTQEHGPSGRQDRPCWSGARHGQTSIPTSELSTPDQIFLSPYLFPYLLLPKSPKSISFPTFDSSPKHSIIRPVQSLNTLPLHPIMCHISLSGDLSRSERCASIDSSWWCFTPGNWGWGGQSWGGLRQGHCFLWVLNLGSCCLFVSLCSSGLTEMSLWWGDSSPVMGLVVVEQSITSARPPTIVSLCSFLGVQTGFYHVTWASNTAEYLWNISSCCSHLLRSQIKNARHRLFVKHRDVYSLSHEANCHFPLGLTRLEPHDALIV